MAKFAFIVVLNSDQEDADEHISSIREIGVIETLRIVQDNDPGLMEFEVGTLKKVDDGFRLSVETRKLGK